MTRRGVVASGLVVAIALLAVASSAQSPKNPRYGPDDKTTRNVTFATDEKIR